MNNQRGEETVIDYVNILIKRSVQYVKIIVSDNVRTTPVPDETNHFIKVKIESPKYNSLFKFERWNVSDAPEPMPGTIIRNIIYGLDKKFTSLYRIPDINSIAEDQEELIIEMTEIPKENDTLEKIYNEIIVNFVPHKIPVKIEINTNGHDHLVVKLCPVKRFLKAKDCSQFEVEMEDPGDILKRISKMVDQLSNLFSYEIFDSKGKKIEKENIPKTLSVAVFKRT